MTFLPELHPRVALLAAAGCAAVTVAWWALKIGWVIGVALVVVVLTVAVLAVVSAVRFRSRLVAPAAAVLCLLVNPVTVTLLADALAR